MLYAVELLSAYFVKRRLVAADILRQSVHLVHADVQHIAALILNGNVVFASVLRGNSLYARNVAYAVDFVNGKIPDFGGLKQIAPLLFNLLFLGFIQKEVARAD